MRPLELWQEVERVLLSGAPLPDDLRDRLSELAQKVCLLADSGLTPKRAALEAAKLAGLTGEDIRAHRTERRERSFRFLLDNEVSRIDAGMKGELTGETKREAAAHKLGKITGRHHRTIERWAKRQRS